MYYKPIIYLRQYNKYQNQNIAPMVFAMIAAISMPLPGINIWIPPIMKRTDTVKINAKLTCSICNL